MNIYHIENKALQAAISIHGLDSFNIYICEYFTYENKATSFKLLTDLATTYIKRFSFSNLYNFLENASSLKGYKLTDVAVSYTHLTLPTIYSV